MFREFENIYVSFSGGKDSGLLLNLLLDFKRTYYPQRTVGVFHQDFEAQYTVTTEYVTKTFERLESEVDPYWVCLPMATRTALSSYEMFWYPWDDRHPELWVRPMPSYSYVINMVPVVGLEPTRCCHQRILNPSRLPIPSYRQRDCKILYTTLKRLASLFDGGKSENNRLINIPFPVEMCYDNLDFITYPMEGFRR